MRAHELRFPYSQSPFSPSHQKPWKKEAKSWICATMICLIKITIPHQIFQHPSSSLVCICVYYLNNRLVDLICLDCGEQMLSSCSCSCISSSRNLCVVKADSVGCISFFNRKWKAKEDQVSKFGIIFPSPKVLVKIRKEMSLISCSKGAVVIVLRFRKYEFWWFNRFLVIKEIPFGYLWIP